MLPWHRVRVVTAFALALPLTLALAAQAHAAGKKKQHPEPEPFGRLTVGQVERRLGRPNIYIFDGNRSETYVEHHLAGAVRLYHDDITPSVLPKSKDATLIFYCMNEL